MVVNRITTMGGRAGGGARGGGAIGLKGYGMSAESAAYVANRLSKVYGMPADVATKAVYAGTGNVANRFQFSHVFDHGDKVRVDYTTDKGFGKVWESKTFASNKTAGKFATKLAKAGYKTF